MNNKYINFYNNLVKLTRNKKLYNEYSVEDKFSERLIILLFHFAFFLNIFKSYDDKNVLQEIFDCFFKQIELSLREMGFGDPSVNKKMKSYISIFYSILNEIDRWDTKNQEKQSQVISQYMKLNEKTLLLVKYFTNYRKFLKNSTLNSLLKGVVNSDF